MKEECRYMDVVNEVDKNHCCFIDPIMRKSSSPWRRICDDNDENCIGVEECNMFECTVPKSDGKGGTVAVQYAKKYWEDIREDRVKKAKKERESPEPTPMHMELNL